MPQRVGSVLLAATFEPENGSATSVPMCFSSLSWCEGMDLSGTPMYHGFSALEKDLVPGHVWVLTHILLANEQPD